MRDDRAGVGPPRCTAAGGLGVRPGSRPVLRGPPARRAPTSVPHRIPSPSAPRAIRAELRPGGGSGRELVRHLERVLRPRRRLGRVRATRLDAASTSGASWPSRPTLGATTSSAHHDPRAASVFLLVDLSGSMSGEKAQAAVLGTILMAETPGRLDASRSMARMSSCRSAASRSATRMSRAFPPWCTRSPAIGRGTTRRPTTMTALPPRGGGRGARLRGDRAILVVVSDGEPAGTRSSAEDLRRAVATLWSIRPCPSSSWGSVWP